MKTLFIILIALLLLFALLICYSALVVASRADEWEEPQKQYTDEEVQEIAEKIERWRKYEQIYRR